MWFSIQQYAVFTGDLLEVPREQAAGVVNVLCLASFLEQSHRTIHGSDSQTLDALRPPRAVIGGSHGFDDSFNLIAKTGGQFARGLGVKIRILFWGVFTLEDGKPFSVR